MTTNPLTIGNDIVDLAYEAMQPPLHPRYLKRILAPSEEDFVRNYPELLWEFWAAKEAGYKALKRIAPETIFSPKRFIYSPEQQELAVEQIILRCIVEKDAGYVGVTCYPPSITKDQFATWISSNEESSPSESVRKLAINGIAQRLSIAHDECEIGHLRQHASTSWSNSTRIPVAIISKSNTRYPLSLSHHGSKIYASVLMVNS